MKNRGDASAKQLMNVVATATSAYVRTSRRSVPQNQWCLSMMCSLAVPAERRTAHRLGLWGPHDQRLPALALHQHAGTAVGGEHDRWELLGFQLRERCARDARRQVGALRSARQELRGEPAVLDRQSRGQRF